MITLDVLYVLAGMLFAVYAVATVLDVSNPKRFTSAALWGLFATTFLIGSELPDVVNGGILVAMALLAGFNLLGRGEHPAPVDKPVRAARWGNRLFIPALIPPVVTLLGTLTLKGVMVVGQPLVDPKQVTLISLGAGIVLATTVALVMFHASPMTATREGRRLMESVGWAGLLPQALAALGAVFAAGHVGDVIGQLATTWLPLGTPLAAVIAYTLGMALFTAIMGNAFAAFPVMTAAIGLPIVVGKFGGDPAIMGAIGMLSGFCGTLTTPMAANFNIVPAALLDLTDRYGVIKAQLPTALLLLLANTVLMYALVYHF